MITVETDHPLASDSNDHLHPHGTKHDNTHHMRFVEACEQYFGRAINFLDLGCAGGGLVADFVSHNHFAVGIEGSDYSQRLGRGEWPKIPKHLFTADITKPFTVVYENGEAIDRPVQFDVISAWEVVEHIAEEDLPAFFANVRRHLAPGGIFVGSITYVSDAHEGIEYHRTIQPKEWWAETMGANGFEPVAETIFDFEDMVRGRGENGPHLSFRVDPSRGGHFCLESR